MAGVGKAFFSPITNHTARFAQNLREAQGLRRPLGAFLFGLIGALAFPPLGLFPVLWLCFPALIFLLQGATDKRAAFLTGWSFAFGIFLLGLYWIAASMFVDIRQFWWAVPLAVAGLPAFLALFYGIVSVIAWRIGLKGVSGALVFALCWFLADEFRGHMLTGFPWNLEGYAWNAALPMLQAGSVIGIYGLTLVTLVSACFMAALNKTASSRIALAFSLVCLIAMAAWGELRLTQATPSVTSTRIRIVQPNIEQSLKWAPQELDHNFERLLQMTASPAQKPVNAIIWPETASPFYLAEDASHRYELAARMPPNSTIITGVIRRDYDNAGKLRVTNSLLTVDNKANITAHYDKFHLVPFGEYVPFRRFLPIHSIAGMGLDFAAGSGHETLQVSGLPSFSPLICYEAVFSGEVTDSRQRPDFLLNVTNDGWYGKTAGPYQHFASARMRAIEEGLPLVRAANTGISGIVDAYGRVRIHLGLGLSGVIDANLPTALPPTLFSRYGDGLIWGLFGFLSFLAAWLRHRKQ